MTFGDHKRLTFYLSVNVAFTGLQSISEIKGPIEVEFDNNNRASFGLASRNLTILSMSHDQPLKHSSLKLIGELPLILVCLV